METKPASKRQPPQEKTKTTRLTQRDLNLLAAIYDFGGVLTTVQLSTLLWPPDVGRRLAGWGADSQQIAAWLEDLPTGLPGRQGRAVEVGTEGQSGA